MPKSDLVNLSCDFCGNHDTIDVRGPVQEVLAVIAKWRGVIDGDSPTPNVQGQDNHRWYDTLECLIAGEKQAATQKAAAANEQAATDQRLEKANESLKNSGYLKPRPELVAN